MLVACVQYYNTEQLINIGLRGDGNWFNNNSKGRIIGGNSLIRIFTKKFRIVFESLSKLL